jgi:vitamin B12 transporter
MRTRTTLALLLAGTAALTPAVPAAGQTLPAAPPAVPAPAGQAPLVLEDIVVSAERTPTEAARTGSTVRTISEGAIAAEGRPFALDYLDQLPGVRVTQQGPPGTVTGLFVRGLPSRYVRVLVDGIEISDPTTPQVTPALTGLLAGDLAGAEVLAGSQSALWGAQAIGGVINLGTPLPVREGIEQRVTVEGGRYDTYRGAYTLLSRTERTDLGVTLQHYRTDGFSAAERRDGNPEADGYETTRLSASGAVYVTDALTLFGSGFYQREEGDQDGFPPPDFLLADTLETYETRSWGLRGGAEFPIGPVASTLAATYFAIDRDTFNEDGSLQFGAEGSRSTVDYLGQMVVDPSLTLQFGLDYAREDAVFRAAPRTTADSWIVGAFAQAIWSPVDPASLSVTLRQDEHSDFGGYTTGRIAAAYVLPTDTTLRASAGSGFRPPSLNELFGQFGPNPDLDPETSVSFDAGVEQRLLAGRARVSATAFRIEVDDLIGFEGAAYVQVPGTTRSKGVELAGAWDATEALTLTAAYTYTDAEQPGGVRQRLVPRHDAVLGAIARPTDRLTLAANVQYVADVEDGTPVPGRLDVFGDYTVVSARAAFAVTEAAELTLRVENLLDEQYQTVRGYGTSDRALYLGLAARF